MDNTKKIMIPIEQISGKILLIRGKEVILDRNLAELYGVETKRLKEAVRRNIERFPSDFMFEMNDKEFRDWRTQFATSNSQKMGVRYNINQWFSLNRAWQCYHLY
ncbi:MAG: ORF6N domain-containing protein [Fidelibacterota bacterium]